MHHMSIVDFTNKIYSYTLREYNYFILEMPEFVIQGLYYFKRQEIIKYHADHLAYFPPAIINAMTFKDPLYRVSLFCNP